MSLINTIKQEPALKKFVHRMLIPKNEAYPRLWVKWFLNPFFHKSHRSAVVRSRTRMDVLPFNKFEMGASSVIEDFSTVNNGVGDVIIGHHSLIGIGNVIIGPVQIGNNVIIAQNVVISGLNHEYKDVHLPIHQQKINTAKITIEDDCWIAANAVITAGVTVGKHSVVGAGAVVTKDVQPYTVVGGNPAKIIKQYNFETKEWISAGRG